MAGARSLSRSTTVTAVGAPGNHKQRQKRRSKDNKSPMVTWDHDNSDTDELSSTTATAAGTTSTGKKRPREITDKKSAAARRGTGKGEKSAKRKPRGNAARSSDEEEDKEASGDDCSTHSVEEEGADDRHKAGVEAPAVGAGGMGDVMAKILRQKLDTKTQAPVLAKRKTKAMKEMEQESVKRLEARGKTAVRRANMTQQFVIPDHTTTDYERQLKKIATRGVVALFNAISKRQTENTPGGSSSAGTGSGAAGTAKSASRHAFLDMLKTGVKPAAGPAEVARETSGSVGAARSAGWNKEDGGEVEGGSWSVLKEHYMMGASSMKNWDQESADSEQDALGGADAMSDDDSD